MTRYEEIKKLSMDTKRELCTNKEKWISFLNTASRIYKYSFEEQILIHAQNPDATAVASMEIWNQKMYCWINKGSKGIALIDPSRKGRLKYVFDVSCVHKAKQMGKYPKLWVWNEQYGDRIMDHMENIYGAIKGQTPEERLISLAEKIAEDQADVFML